MSAQTSLKAAVFGMIVLLAGVATYWLYAPSPQQPDVETETPLTATNSAAVSLTNLPKAPSHETALQTLFNVSSGSDQAKTGEDTLTSFWFEQTLKVGNEIMHAVFFKSQQLDESGELIDSHGTPVIVAVITYQLNDQQWQVVSKQTGFTEAGAWGDVPDTDINTLILSPKASAILIDFSDSMGGYTEEGKTVYAYIDRAWRDLGYLSTGADNSGTCDDTPVSDNTEGDDIGLGACWSYHGTITTQTGNNPDYPDLLVVKTGTDSDENHTGTRPAKNVLYRFDGKRYVEAQ